MENEQAVFVLAREQRRAAIDEAERLTKEREADEAAEAAIQAEQWRREYQDLLSSRRPGLQTEIAQVDQDLVKALADLQQAHARALALLERREEAEKSVSRLHQRMHRLSKWMGTPWIKDMIATPPPSVPWRVAAWVSRPWPGE